MVLALRDQGLQRDLVGRRRFLVPADSGASRSMKLVDFDVRAFERQA